MMATLLISIMLTAYVVSFVARQRRDRVYGSKCCNNSCGPYFGFDTVFQK